MVIVNGPVVAFAGRGLRGRIQPSASILAARVKSLRVRPPTACVVAVMSKCPHPT